MFAFAVSSLIRPSHSIAAIAVVVPDPLQGALTLLNGLLSQLSTDLYNAFLQLIVDYILGFLNRPTQAGTI
jgi:hypothetical protein